MAEKGGDPPIVVLAPFLIGMMVALSAGQAQTQEHLGRVVHKLFGIDELLIPHGRRMLVLIPSGGQDLASKLVKRHVVGHGLPNPVMKGEGSLDEARLTLALDGKDVVPEVRE